MKFVLVRDIDDVLRAAGLLAPKPQKGSRPPRRRKR
jgi:hypothetical protein